MCIRDSPGNDLEDFEPREFMPEDILRHAKPSGVSRIVMVQIGNYGPDNSILTDTIQRFPGVFGGIGQVDHDGTYNSKPIVIAAGLATLKFLTAEEDKIYGHFNSLGSRLRKGLTGLLQDAGISSIVSGLGPVVQVSLTDQDVITDYRDWASRDSVTYQKLVTDLVFKGVRTTGRGSWYVSYAHTAEDIDITLNSVKEVLINFRQ